MDQAALSPVVQSFVLSAVCGHMMDPCFSDKHENFSFLSTFPGIQVFCVLSDFFLNVST